MCNLKYDKIYVYVKNQTIFGIVFINHESFAFWLWNIYNKGHVIFTIRECKVNNCRQFTD